MPPIAMPSIVFFEPRIPENTGAAIRLSAVSGAHLRLVEPLGFTFEESKAQARGARLSRPRNHDGAPRL